MHSTEAEIRKSVIDKVKEKLAQTNQNHEDPLRGTDRHARADIFTNDPAYGDGTYVAGYNALWDDNWRHMDNLDHIRPTLGLPNHDAVGAWNLPGRDFPGPAAEPIV
jgi:hypothetical protein